MGIKHFFGWFRNNEQLRKVISDKPPNQIDHVLIDMNGIIHESAQYVFKYGKFSSRMEVPDRLKSKIKQPIIEDLYLKIQDKVNEIIKILNPQKTIYLAIDGVAPKSKQNQQRQRRFRAAFEKMNKDKLSKKNNDTTFHAATGSTFDSNCITAGTKFMSDLSSNLENLAWVKKESNVQIKISTDNEPGEGEHKLIDWIRQYTSSKNERFEERLEEKFCVVGLDADLILLCCLLKPHNVFIMREDDYFGINYIDIKKTKAFLPISVHDLLVLSCFVGNDFLPAVPSLEIKESPPELGALDFFFEIYKNYFPSYLRDSAFFDEDGLLINKNTGVINFRALKFIFKKISEREQNIMMARQFDSERFSNDLWTGDIEDYRQKYYKNKLESADKEKIVTSYLKTVQWVYHYYSTGIPSWDWYYPYNYTLHSDDFSTLCPINVIKFLFYKSQPCHPHEQLLRVIPPMNKHLVPLYLHDELDRISKVANTFKIDKAGKREEWEAITIVDFVNPEIQEFKN